MCVQFMFAQNMNEFMNDRSLNAFMHNTVKIFHADLIEFSRSPNP